METKKEINELKKKLKKAGKYKSIKSPAEKLFTKILLITLLQFFLLSGLWTIDIGASIMNYEAAGMKGEATGLFGTRDGNTQYHLGLAVVYVVFAIQLSWLLYLILKKEVKNGNKNS